MGTEVLRPQGCLLQPLRNPSPHPKPLRRRREGSPKQPTKPRLAMGQVTILRRGESLEAARARKGEAGAMAVAAAPSASAGWDQAVFGLGRLGPDPAMIPKEIRLRPPTPTLPDVYAGSAFALSPSPRALPLPSFSRRKEGLAVAPAVVDCSATKDLRRLLRLE